MAEVTLVVAVAGDAITLVVADALFALGANVVTGDTTVVVDVAG